MYKDGFFVGNAGSNDLGSMPYAWFDHQPDSGWRALAKQGRYREAGEMILRYLRLNLHLLPYEVSNLQFHAGQMFAFNNDNAKAVECFTKAVLIPDDHDTIIKWNNYVNGTIAFLKKDKEHLKICIQNIIKGKYHGPLHNNLCILQNMLNNVGRSYLEVYEMPIEDASFQ